MSNERNHARHFMGLYEAQSGVCLARAVTAVLMALDLVCVCVFVCARAHSCACIQMKQVRTSVC